MTLEVKVNSKNFTVEDFWSAVDAIREFVIKKVLPSVLVMMCFSIILGVSLLIFLSAIFVAHTPIIRILCIIASILLAVFACKKVYPKTYSYYGIS